MLELPTLVQALLDLKIYPHAPQKVELVQTQMSFIFLTGDYVYKVKKPVDLGYLDYTTLEKRRLFCYQELKLNRRLSPDIYLEVVPIAQQGDKILLGGGGEVIEYAVKMRQLPSQRMMDVLLSKNRVSERMVHQVAQKLADFHQQAETNAEISSYGGLDAILTNTEENFTQTEKYIGVSISPEHYQRIKAYTDAFARQNTPLFDKRIKDGRIRDCHGDLHSAHICFIDGICIYDCIEFNDRFRYCDVASEIAFLAMDLDYHRHPDLSKHFIDAYVEASQDEELLKLLDFYKCYRAYVRGKVESFKLDDPLIPEEEKTRALDAAKRYFGLCRVVYSIVGEAPKKKSRLNKLYRVRENTGGVKIKSNIAKQIQRMVHTGTVVPKPEAKTDYVVKGWGKRRDENALIYFVPNRKKPNKPYQKGVTESEWNQAYQQVMNNGIFSREWFNQNMQPCADEGGCNFTTIGGIFELLGIAIYERGLYRKKGR